MRKLLALSILIFCITTPVFAGDGSESGPETKGWIAVIGIIATFIVSFAGLIHSLRNDRRASFVNTVSASRLKWIDSLRDSVSEFIAVSSRLVHRSPETQIHTEDLLLKRDTLVHQIVLHLNPDDSEDRRIKSLVDHVSELTDKGDPTNQASQELIQLRDATAAYLKKEWNRVKNESVGGGDSGSRKKTTRP